MGLDLPKITANGHFDRAESTNVFIIKSIFAIKSLLLWFCIKTISQQQLAIKGISYLPMRKINMFVGIGVKIRGLMAKASTLFSAPV